MKSVEKTEETLTRATGMEEACKELVEKKADDIVIAKEDKIQQDKPAAAVHRARSLRPRLLLRKPRQQLLQLLRACESLIRVQLPLRGVCPAMREARRDPRRRPRVLAATSRSLDVRPHCFMIV